jgi:uncharacterized protein involved in type VI secretion and phage assembly
MSNSLFESIARIARHEAQSRFVAGIGIVTEVHTSDSGEHAVSVAMRDSDLVLAHVPVAVSLMGLAAIPEVGDLVVVLFLNGDANAPVAVGQIYHPDKKPPKHAANELVLRLPSGTDEGDLNLVITRDTPTIKLTLPGDVTLEIEKENIVIGVGAMTLQLTGKGGGRAELAAGGSKITLKQDGDVTISSQGKLSFEAAEIEIKGQGQVTLKGAKIDLN